MTPEVSRVLAVAKHRLRLGVAATEELVARYGDVASVADLPDWLVEQGDSHLAVRAAGHDVTPGHDELHHYWTRDPEGLAKWAGSPTPFTTLYHHLVKFVGPERAKRMAAAWVHEVLHYWPGSDLNRVAHGHPPRGHKIGPG